MATRLINILSFTDVAAGDTVAQAHNLNSNGVALIPDLLMADVSGFTVTADNTNVSVTNNGSTPADINVWAEYKHSMLRLFGAVQTTQLTPAPFVASSGSGSAGPTTVFQWTSDVTWDDLYAQIAAVSGPKIVLVAVEDAPLHMTARGGDPTDLNDCIFMGPGGSPFEGMTAQIVVDTGFQFAARDESGLNIVRLTSKDLGWDFSGLAVPAYVAPDPTNDYAYFTFDGSRVAGTNVGIGVIDGTMYLVSRASYLSGLLCKVEADTFSVIRSSGGSGFGQAVFADNGDNNTINIFVDGTVELDPATFTAAGLLLTYTLNTFATDGTALYRISVSAGNVVATAV